MAVINPWISAQPTPTASLPAPVQSKSLIWADDFTALQSVRWRNGFSWSFPNGGPTNNFQGNLLNYLNASAVTNTKGKCKMTATSGAPGGRWNVGLITTETTSEYFELLPNDYWEARIKLPVHVGAWVSMWTWGDDIEGVPQNGNGEVDVFEWHGDNQGVLELTNHTRDPGGPHLDYTPSPPLAGGNWITMGCLFGLTTNRWYLNNVEIWSDNAGVPSNWRAHPILSLFIADGEFHDIPVSTEDVIVAEMDWTRAYR